MVRISVGFGIPHCGRPDLSILAPWPKLVDLVGRLDDIVRVEEHPFDGLRTLAASLVQHIEEASDEQLNGREPLLAVND